MTTVITFLSDYGQDDDFVGVCHGVIARIAPEARIIDVTHGHRPPRRALRRARPAPRAAVLPAGRAPRGRRPRGRRRAARVARAHAPRRTASSSAPTTACSRWPPQRFGGAVEAVDVGRSPHRLEPRPATFHGRDLFAPVAAHLAAGAPLADAGDPIDADELAPLHMPLALAATDGGARRPRARPSTASATSCSTSSTPSWPARASSSATGSRSTASAPHYATTFADVAPGELLLYEDAYRTLALAVNRGSAATLTSASTLDAEVRISRPAATAMLGRAAAAPARRRLDQRPRPGAGARRRAARDARHRRASSARGAAGRAARGRLRPGGRCCCRSSCATPRRCCRSPRRLAVAEVARRGRARSSGPTTCCSTDARWRASWPRAARTRAGPCSGSASTSRCASTSSRPSCTTPRARSA